MMTTKFHEVPVGGKFEFRGRRYEKLALSLARDEERCGNVFHDLTEVLAEAPPVISPTQTGATASNTTGLAGPPPLRVEAPEFSQWTRALVSAPGRREWA